MSKFKWSSIFEWGGHASTLWGLLPAAWQTVLTLGLSALTAYFGLQEVGWARALFLASGVLAFGMVTVFLSLRISQILGVFQRLTVATVGIQSITLNDEAHEIDRLTLNCVLRNDSQRPMFYKLKRSLVTAERKMPASTNVDQNIIVIPAFGATQVVMFATVEDIPAPKDRAPEGRLEIEVEYGADDNQLNFLLHEVIRFGINIIPMNPGNAVPLTTKKQKKPPLWPPGQKGAQIVTAVEKLEHSRVAK